MKVFKRGKVYWFDLQFEGKRYQKSTKERSKVKAENIAAAFRTALANRRVGIIERKAAPLFGEAMKAFLEWSEQEHAKHPGTYQRYLASSKALLVFRRFQGKAIDEITPAMIEGYKALRSGQRGKRTKRPLKPATVNRELACLKAMYNHALKERHDFRNPVSDVESLQERNEQDRILTFQEQRSYLAVASPNVKDVATLMLESGMRPEEVYRARVDRIDLENGYLFNPYGKTPAARRRIPLTSTALAIVKRRVGAATGPYLFPHRKDQDRSITTAHKGHVAALRDSKVAPFRLYDCRHTWATRAAQSGMDMPTLAALLGHSKLNMVMRYVHPQARHQAEEVRRLEAFNAAQEIAEVEAEKRASGEVVPTISTTLTETETTPPETTPTLN